MSLGSRTRMWLRAVFRRRDAEREMQREMDSHVAMEQERLESTRLSPNEAHRRAMITFGGVERYKEAVRDEQGTRILGELSMDLHYALRQFRHHPGFAIAVVGVFSLGIGANTAMFTLVNTVLVSPLPYAEPDRLVFLTNGTAGTSAPDFLDFRARNTLFSSLALWGSSQATLSGGFDPEEVTSLDVSADFLATVGVRSVIGRDFSPEEEANPRTAVILSNALWLRRYGGDRTIVWHNIVIDGRGTEVVGIAPPELDRNLTADIYRPFDFHAPHATVRAYRTQPVVARLRPGVSLPSAQAAMNIVENQLGTVYPEDANRTIRLQPYHETVVGGARSQLLYLLAAVVVVLLIACGNIVSLMFTRATARQGEFATRVALGASRARLVQQLVTESTLLAIVGGAIGFLLATALLRALQLNAVTALPRMAELGLNPASFVFTALLSLAAGTIVGAASAWRATASTLHPALTGGGRSSHSRGSTRTREVVVALQLAASLVLLASASVLLESFWRLAHVNPGFDDSGVLTGTVFIPAERYSIFRAVDWWTTALPQLAVIPHVTGVSAASQIPLAPGGNASYVPAGTATGPGIHQPTALINVVAERYFETMRIPILSGTGFSKEGAAGQFVETVISQSIAKKLSLFGAVIGQRMIFPDFGGFTGEVVGVAGDVRADLGREAPDIIYFPLKQMRGWARNMHLLVRTDGDPLALVPQIRRLVAQRDPLLAFGRVRTMSDIIGHSVARQRL